MTTIGADARQIAEDLQRELENESELEPYDHDGCYRMIQETAKAFARKMPERVRHEDLDLFYYLIVDVRNDVKVSKIEASSLDEASKRELLIVHDEVLEKGNRGEYSCWHYKPHSRYGIFRHTIGTFNKEKNGVSKGKLQTLIGLFASIASCDDEDTKLGLAEQVFKDGVSGIAAPTASMILHCIDPYTFPIMNKHEGRDCIYSLINVPGLSKTKTARTNIKNYVNNCRAIRVYRNEHFPFKNYRIIDLAEADLPKRFKKEKRFDPLESVSRGDKALAVNNLLEDSENGDVPFDEIEALDKETNIFKILRITRKEIRHSNMLAWLMNPRGNHHLADSVLRGFLERLCEVTNENQAESIRKQLGTKSLGDFEVKREKHITVNQKRRYIDILLKSKAKDFAVIIENKTFSGEHDEQLKDYKTGGEERLADYADIIYVYLTPEGKAPSDPDSWVSMSYEQILEAIEDAEKEKDGNLDPDVEMILRHYKKAIRAELLGEDDLKNKCRDLYRKYRLAFDVIYRYEFDEIELLASQIQEYIEDSDGELSSLSQSKRTVEFSTEILDDSAVLARWNPRFVIEIDTDEVNLWLSWDGLEYQLEQTDARILLDLEKEGWTYRESKSAFEADGVVGVTSELYNDNDNFEINLFMQHVTEIALKASKVLKKHLR